MTVKPDWICMPPPLLPDTTEFVIDAFPDRPSSMAAAPEFATTLQLTRAIVGPTQRKIAEPSPVPPGATTWLLAKIQFSKRAVVAELSSSTPPPLDGVPPAGE